MIGENEIMVVLVGGFLVMCIALIAADHRRQKQAKPTELRPRGKNWFNRCWNKEDS